MRSTIDAKASKVIDAQTSPALCTSELSLELGSIGWVSGSGSPSETWRKLRALKARDVEKGMRRVPK